MKYPYLLFDADDTLFDFPKASSQAFSVMCGKNRIPDSAETYRLYHKINLVLCKDLSRLGRDYIEAGKYTDFVFPSLGCRFIALNDGVDMFRKNNEMLVILKNVMKNISHSGKVSNDFSIFGRF